MDNFGTLSPRAVTAQGVIPVEGAAVTVMQEIGGKKQLIAHRLTDRDGIAAEVKIAAPDEEMSTVPGAAAPFAACDVRFDKAGYYSFMISGAQIFPNTVSIQTAEMLPLPDGSFGTRKGDAYSVAPQNL